MRTQRFGWIAAVIAGIAVASLSAPTADAALIVDQQPTADIGLPSALFTLTPTASVEEIDSFTTAAAYRLGTLTAFTSSDGLGPAISVGGSIYSGAPPGDPGAQLVTTAFGTLMRATTLLSISAARFCRWGAIILTAFVVRQSPNDGIWYWNTTFSGPQALTWPIGGGLSPAPETSSFTDEPVALAYTLTGTRVAVPVPEPPSVTLTFCGFALVVLVAGRWRQTWTFL
jgi:hypothetical protein